MKFIPESLIILCTTFLSKRVVNVPVRHLKSLQKKRKQYVHVLFSFCMAFVNGPILFVANLDQCPIHSIPQRAVPDALLLSSSQR